MTDSLIFIIYLSVGSLLFTDVCLGLGCSSCDEYDKSSSKNMSLLRDKEGSACCQLQEL